MDKIRFSVLHIIKFSLTVQEQNADAYVKTLLAETTHLFKLKQTRAFKCKTFNNSI